MSGLGLAARREMVACRDREVTGARRARSLFSARCPPRFNQTAVFVARALAAVALHIFNGDTPRDLGRWWFSWSSQPARS